MLVIIYGKYIYIINVASYVLRSAELMQRSGC